MRLEIISKHPVESRRPTPLLFIHGMLHGAWCWNAHFLDYFAQHGFAAHAVNLRGHGAVTDGKNCAGPELPITLMMSQTQFGNCPAHPS